MPSITRAPTQQIVTAVPIGSYIDVFKAGAKAKLANTAVSRAAFPELSAAFPPSAAGQWAAVANAAHGTGNWMAITYGQGVFVAVSSTGTIATSQDGLNWTNINYNSTAWIDVCFANGMFIAIGGANSRMISADGLNWTPGTVPVVDGLALQQIAFGNGLWIIVVGGYNTVDSNKYLTSPDGVNWTQRNLPAAQDWRVARFGNGLFVVMSTMTSNVYATSADGINWTQRAMPSAQNWSCAYFANGLWIALVGLDGGASNVFATSADGINWTQRVMPASYEWADVAYGNGYWIVVNKNGSGGGAKLYVSTDGMTWFERAVSNNPAKAIAFGGGLFVSLAQIAASTVSQTVYIEGPNSQYVYLAGTVGKFLRVA